MRGVFLFLFASVLSVNVHGQNGTMTDWRDPKEYKTVQIGEQIWMAENLAYNNPKNQSDCFRDSVSNCIKYGRLYTWEVANKICPKGWRLPTKSEFESLLSYAGGRDRKKALKILTADSILGFNALLGGYYYSCYSTPTVLHTTGYLSEDGVTAFWTSTEEYYSGMEAISHNEKPMADIVFLGPKGTLAFMNVFYKKCALPVRCIKD
jgi:uncharacterized protein (TIGR02145 family)